MSLATLIGEAFLAGYHLGIQKSVTAAVAKQFPPGPGIEYEEKAIPPLSKSRKCIFRKIETKKEMKKKKPVRPWSNDKEWNALTDEEKRLKLDAEMDEYWASAVTLKE